MSVISAKTGITPSFVCLIFTIIFAIILIYWLVLLLIRLLIIYFGYLVTAIPFYMIAKNCYFDHPWVTLLPMGKNYIAFTLPFSEYNLGFFETKNRKLIYWIWFSAEILMYIIFAVMAFFLSPILIRDVGIPSSSTGKFFMSDEYQIAAITLAAGVSFLMLATRCVVHWRKNYDLLKAYGFDEHAMWAPLANIACPLVMVVFSYILINQEPINGGYGYYMEDYDPYK